MKKCKRNGVASAASWRSAMVADRLTRAEHLRLPSGATILAVKPEPLEWILSGRIPQHLLGAALENSAPLEMGAADSSHSARVMTREEILDLAWFARQLVKASVVKPRIGDGQGEVPLDDIPVRDRAFIFEWACRALREGRENNGAADGAEQSRSARYARAVRGRGNSLREDLSSEKLERFRKE
jgi:hypothetical protein